MKMAIGRASDLALGSGRLRPSLWIKVSTICERHGITRREAIRFETVKALASKHAARKLRAKARKLDDAARGLETTARLSLTDYEMRN